MIACDRICIAPAESSNCGIGRSRCIEAMWKVVMSEEVAKAVQSVVDRVNQAAARRPKVSFFKISES